MATNNSINAPLPISSTNGATGVSNPTANTLPVANGSSAFTFQGPMTNGQLQIGNTGNAPTLGTITAGTGIAVTNGAGTIAIATTGASSGTTWNPVGSNITMSPYNGYINVSSNNYNLQLPTTPVVGWYLEIYNYEDYLSITQSAGDRIIGSTSFVDIPSPFYQTTSGSTGSLLLYPATYIRLFCFSSGGGSQLWTLTNHYGQPLEWI